MKTKKLRKCVGCGSKTHETCPQCGKPTCQRAVGLCGHVEGLCAACVGERLRALFSPVRETCPCQGK